VTLATILSLEAIGDDVWRAWTPEGTRRPDIFGGQVAGQALLAASQTVDPAYSANSVHCSFLRRGQPAHPLDIRVERTRTGRTYANRRVEVVQDGKLIFSMLASFHVDEPGREFVQPIPDGIPDPDAIASDTEPVWDPALDMRSLHTSPPRAQWWCRANGPFPDDPTMHRSALLYASDLRSGGAALMAVGYISTGEDGAEEGMPPPGGNFGSLDHAMWFHRAARVDDWFFCDVQPLNVLDSRGLVLGTIFDRAGHHVATFTQEMFMKPATPTT
jgi:acyl-CoA thioesterase II